MNGIDKKSTFASKRLEMEPPRKRHVLYVHLFSWFPFLRALLQKRFFRHAVRQSFVFLFAIVALAFIGSNVAVAQQATEQEVDPVALMKAAYYEQFSKLPASRNCTPSDVRGYWVEQKIYDFPRYTIASELQKSGAEYMLFGDYNRFISKRSEAALSAEYLAKNIDTLQKQYIATVKGTLYIYANYALEQSYLCFMTTEAKEDVPAGVMLLANPLEEGKPLVMRVFKPQAF